jgi:predicted Fe-Mo cluster-binding NifX family protein
MRILFTAYGNNWDAKIDPRFGRTQYIIMYDTEEETFDVHDNREINNREHGAGSYTAQRVCELNPDVIVTGNGPGNNAANVLKMQNIKIYVDASDLTIKEAYKAFLDNKFRLID